MIRQLQKRFIRIAVISLTMAMILVVAIVNMNRKWKRLRSLKKSATISLSRKTAVNLHFRDPPGISGT